jgi:hypothetical protein
MNIAHIQINVTFGFQLISMGKHALCYTISSILQFSET